MRSSVTYTPYATSSEKQTGDIITFTQSEQRNLLSETCDNAKSGDKYDDSSIMPPLISKGEIDAMDSGDDSYDEPMSTDMLEDICGGRKSHTRVNRRESQYKISDRIKQRQP